MSKEELEAQIIVFHRTLKRRYNAEEKSISKSLVYTDANWHRAKSDAYRYALNYLNFLFEDVLSGEKKIKEVQNEL